MALTLILSHGMESGPGATKVTALAARCAARGVAALRPDYRDLPTWRARVEHLLATLDTQTGPVALMGSSIGAYISALVSLQRPIAGLFLLAPPIEAPPMLPALQAAAVPTWIVHGWRDELIAPAHVVAFAERQRARLLLIDGDHRLEGHVPALEREFDGFLDLLMAATGVSP